jgi:hypothetical protein
MRLASGSCGVRWSTVQRGERSGAHDGAELTTERAKTEEGVSAGRGRKEKGEAPRSGPKLSATRGGEGERGWGWLRDGPALARGGPEEWRKGTGRAEPG